MGVEGVMRTAKQANWGLDTFVPLFYKQRTVFNSRWCTTDTHRDHHLLLISKPKGKDEVYRVWGDWMEYPEHCKEAAGIIIE